jgi:UDP-glucose 4-epimerase
MMNILVTGATGLLGRELVSRLAEKNRVYIFVRGTSKLTAASENIIPIEGDLFGLDVGILPNDIDVIYYLAQSRQFRNFPDGAIDTFEVNVYSPLKMADWAQKSGVKMFFYASSGGIYKNPNEPIKEFFDLNANEKNGFYLDGKLAAEILLRNYSKLFRTFAILRPFFIYGPGQDRGMLIPRLITNVLRGDEILLSGEDGIKINPIYSTDAAMAFAKLIDLEGEYIFNIAGSEAVSIRALADMIGNILNKEPVFKYIARAQYDLVADISLMKEMLCEQKVSLEDGLKMVIGDFNV